MDQPLQRWHVRSVMSLIVLSAVFGPIPTPSNSHAGATAIERENGLDTLVIHLRMQAVILSDDDGKNPGAETLSIKQLRHWIQKANDSYRLSYAKMIIDFDATKDLARLKDSCLNHLDHNQNEHASEVAAQYPGKMVVFFRAFGPDSEKKTDQCRGKTVTGNGYTAYNSYVPIGTGGCTERAPQRCSASYVVMPSVYCAGGVGRDFADPKNPPTGNDSSGCPIFVNANNLIYVQNYNALVHEVGHYFGLPHTFPGPNDKLSSPGLLQRWYNGPPYANSTRSINVFDGDSPQGPRDNGGYTGWTFTVPDTPPDAGAQIFVSNGVNMCRTPTDKTISDSSGAKVTFRGLSFTLAGEFNPMTLTPRPYTLTFTPDKSNVMSYFLCKDPMTFSPGQLKTMRDNILKDPNRSYLVCKNPDDADFKPYLSCP